MTQLVRVLITRLTAAVAVVLGRMMWRAYMDAPWTRDGTVRAYVVALAAEVAGETDYRTGKPLASGKRATGSTGSAGETISRDAAPDGWAESVNHRKVSYEKRSELSTVLWPVTCLILVAVAATTAADDPMSRLAEFIEDSGSESAGHP